MSQWVSGESGLPFARLCLLLFFVLGREFLEFIWIFISDPFPITIEYALGNVPASGYEDLESTEGWLADCFNDAEMQFSPDDLYASFSGPLIFRFRLVIQNNLTIVLFESGIFQEQMMCILILQVDDIVFYPLMSANIVILYSFLCASSFIQKKFFLLQSLLPLHHHMNKMWFSSMSLEPREILSSKV